MGELHQGEAMANVASSTWHARGGILHLQRNLMLIANLSGRYSSTRDPFPKFTSSPFYLMRHVLHCQSPARSWLSEHPMLLW